MLFLLDLFFDCVKLAISGRRTAFLINQET